MYRWASRVPRSQKREKRPTGAGEKRTHVKKKKAFGGTYQMHFLWTAAHFSPAVPNALFWTFARCFSGGRGFFLVLSSAGHQGGRLSTTAQVWVPAGLCGACSGRSKSRILASKRGIDLRPAKANQAYAKPRYHFLSFFHPSMLLFSKYHSSCQRLGSRSTRAALQAYPFVTATNSVSACEFVTERARACHCRAHFLRTSKASAQYSSGTTAAAAIQRQ